MKTTSSPYPILAVLVLAFVATLTPLTRSDAWPTRPMALDTLSGVREVNWSPDGKRLVVTRFDRIWIMGKDGSGATRLISEPGNSISERDGVWSPDGTRIAFAAEGGNGFDLWVVAANGDSATRITSAPGHERWPSWIGNDRLLYSARNPDAEWRLRTVAVTPGSTPAAFSPDSAAEWQGRVSPDGQQVVFLSDRESESGSVDLWLRSTGGGKAVRLTNSPDAERFPTWAPEGKRVAYASGFGSSGMIWVVEVPEGALSLSAGSGVAGRGTMGGRGASSGRGNQFGGRGTGAPLASLLASRQDGVPAWSPDGELLAIATRTSTDPGYNGDPLRNSDDAPSLWEPSSSLRLVPAPRLVDLGARSLSFDAVPFAGTALTTFDQTWETLHSLYYNEGARAESWRKLREKYRPLAATASDPNQLEDVIDAMVAEQPLIKDGAVSNGAVITSGHPLASQAGAEILAQGGNIVDAAIAVDFALGVTEPDASSIGGDGMALLFLKGMSAPIAIDFKDMTPGHANGDDPRLFTATGGRTAVDGPTVANIPGIVAGMDLLYRKYGSGKVAWSNLLAPAIRIAQEGFILDDALPTTIREGRSSFAKYPESARIFLPGGRVPRAGERFSNPDYANTLKLIATEGAETFYRGNLARKIVDDLAANGGVITLSDLAQYRAIERTPLQGRYRDHLVFSAPPPVSTGAQMIESLQILDQYHPKPGATPGTDADFLHYLIEAWKIRDGGVQIADPDRWPVELGNHLTRDHAAERFKLLRRDSVYVAPSGRGGGGRGGAAAGGRGGRGGLNLVEAASYPGSDEPGKRIGTGTTSFALADAEGNMIVVTQTLSTWGGNYYVSKGLGFLYNDHFRSGRGGTGFGSMLPLMRSTSTSVPTLLFAPSQGVNSGIPGYTPRMAVGAAGNAWIPASVYSIIANVIDGRLNAQKAIEAPRLLISGSNIQIEDRFPRMLLADLERRGHRFGRIGRKGEVRQGYAALVIIDGSRHEVSAGAEPRRSHGAVAVPARQ